jgi:short-subunit dehydrogenase
MPHTEEEEVPNNMKTLLSIGAGPGIGLATAERFAQEGFRVVLAARSAARLDAMGAELRAKGVECDVAVVDASDADGVRALVADVARRHGGVDVLHYNAASLRQATIDQQPADSFSADLAVNIGGALVATQAVVPLMEARGGGTVLLPGGAFGLHPSPDYLSVSIGKAGLRVMALALFEPLKARGVHVAIVNVAAYVTPGSADAAGVAEAFWAMHAADVADWRAEAAYPEDGAPT